MSPGLRPLEFGVGLIEGFYGRAWSDADRLAMPAFLAGAGYRYHVYAPKSDTILRRAWRERWTAERESHLHAMASRARKHGVAFGVGLSPLGLAEAMDQASLRALREKVAYLAAFDLGILCLLFDDMPRGVDDLAERQAAIVQEVIAAAPGIPHLVVCPSYYARDPVLERLFGAMPAGYWETLGELLPPEAGIFWTGEKVCSDAYSAADLQDIGARLRRAPVLWDNYPVNDGARLVDFLHIDAFRNRDAGLRGQVTAHFANPMNQCWLSRIPLATLPMVYDDGQGYEPEAAFAAAAEAVAGKAGAALLAEDRERFQRHGLAVLDPQARAALAQRYARFNAPWAAEIIAWLRGEYAFDPACLTG